MTATGKKPISRTKRIGLPRDGGPVAISKANAAVALALAAENIDGGAAKERGLSDHVRVDALLLDCHVLGTDGATYRPWLNLVSTSGKAGRIIGFSLSPKPASLAEIAALVVERDDSANTTGPAATLPKAQSPRRRAGLKLPHASKAARRGGSFPASPQA